MNDNLKLYDRFRKVPEAAKKTIKGGRLNGFTDINPMWRIKALTEMFGPCGLGWWYKITDKRMEGEGSEIRAFVDIELYYAWNGEISQPVVGTGGASFLTVEKNGAYTSDECYKMALTDAISVAAKALGVGADVYWDKDCDKYTTVQTDEEAPLKCEACGEIIQPFTDAEGKTVSPERIAATSKKNFGRVLCVSCAMKAKDEG